MSTTTTAALQPQYRTIDGVSIRFAESEQHEDHAILLNPWPESMFAWEQIWVRLSEQMHLVAIDLPGFGLSERRADLLSPKAMGEFLIKVADAFDVAQPHVVGPDVGTGAALFAAAESPGRLRSLAVGSGGTAVPIQLGGVLKEWVENPDFDSYRRADPRQIVTAAMGSIQKYEIPERVREDYLAGYVGDRFVESMRYVRRYPEELPILRDLLPGIQTPVQIIQGTRDTAVPAANGEFLRDRLPRNKYDVIDAGHFSWEEAPDEYAEILLSWWGGGCQAV
jgi:pimeloyl-ACP methyl ester carboxylesterase